MCSKQLSVSRLRVTFLEFDPAFDCNFFLRFKSQARQKMPRITVQIRPALRFTIVTYKTCKNAIYVIINRISFFLILRGLRSNTMFYKRTHRRQSRPRHWINALDGR